MTHKKTIRICAIIVLLVLIEALLIFLYFETPKPRQMKYVVHGAGEIVGLNFFWEETLFTVSNSKEALLQCKDAGVKYVELDFSFTSDDELVCLHDWYHMYSPYITTDVKMTLEEFMKLRIYRSFTPMCLDDVFDYLKSNLGTFIITDIKTDNIKALEKIAKQYPLLKNRLIIQIYSMDEYDQVNSLGFDNIIFTLYRLPWDEKTDVEAIKKFARTHSLYGITFSSELCEIDGYVDSMLEIGVPLYVHTVDDQAEQQKYFDMGITGIYTNKVMK